MNINSVTISGNITRDSEVRVTPAGKAILSFGIAVNERHKNAQGEWEDYPNFFDCVRFTEQQSANWWQQKLTKGTHVTVSGRLRYSSWEKDGQKRSKVEIIAESMDAYVSNTGTQQQGQYQQPAYSAPAQQPSPEDFYDEDMAF